LTEVIETFEREQLAMGGSPEELALVQKFKGWKDELEGIMAGHVIVGQESSTPVEGVTAKEGGLFED
jgi:hypothetical protein